MRNLWLALVLEFEFQSWLALNPIMDNGIAARHYYAAVERGWPREAAKALGVPS